MSDQNMPWPPGPWGYNLNVGFYWVKQPENLPAHLDLSDPAVRTLVLSAPELYRQLAIARDIFKECAIDTTGTPSERFFRAMASDCDVVLAKSRGETAQISPDRVGTGVEPPDVK